MGNNVLAACTSSIKNNIFLATLITLSCGLSLILRQPLGYFPTYVNWNTIVTLSGLLLITTGIEKSGLFYLIAYRISRRINNERLLALFLIFVAAILSLFLTNDIALFIVIPLTLNLQKISDNDYSKMIVFEAIAVNVGSSLTAIGNPQNIFLWHRWGISFTGFICEMAPLVFILTVWLSVFVFFTFPNRYIKPNPILQHPYVNRTLFFLSAALLILFILAVELNIEQYFLIVILLFYLVFYKNVALKTDWVLIFLFIFIFIDINLVCQIKVLQQLLGRLDLHNPRTLLLSSALFSQVISNVSSSVLLTHYSSSFKIISYGVNIGGNGLLIGSFANLIALRFIDQKSKYFIFHAYSLPFFIFTLTSALFLLF